MPQLPWPSPPADAVHIEAQDQLAGLVVMHRPWPSPPADEVDLEAQLQPAGLVVRHRDRSWAEIMVAFCLPSAVDIALASIQSQLEAQRQPAGLVVRHRPWPSPPADAVDLEAPAQPAGLVARRPIMAWADIAVAFCLPSAVAIALASIQSQLSSTFYALLMAILLAFASFFVSEFMNSKFVVTAQVLRKVGIFFTVSAYFVAITIPFPFYLKVTSCVVYTISFLTILVSRCF